MDNTPTDARFFGFESDFVDSMRCIPMAARLRLDRTGVKLKLNEWSKLDPDLRMALAQGPCGSPVERDLWKAEITGLVAKACGAAPSLLPEAVAEIWEDAGSVPDQVRDQARSLGLSVDPAAWAALSPLQRFALVKLSRPGHENRNFRPAMEEFGLAAKAPLYGLIVKAVALPGRREELIPILSGGASAMPGCLDYVIARDPKDADTVWITEVWADAASHKASLSLPSVKDAIARGKPLIARFEQFIETEPVRY